MSKSEMNEIADLVIAKLNGQRPAEENTACFDSMAGLVSPSPMAKAPKAMRKEIDDATNKMMEMIMAFPTDEEQYEAIQMLRYKLTTNWRNRVEESYKGASSLNDRARQLDRFIEATTLP